MLYVSLLGSQRFRVFLQMVRRPVIARNVYDLTKPWFAVVENREVVVVAAGEGHSFSR